MKRQLADSTLQGRESGTATPRWESPTATQIRVSAEVTAYVAIWDEGN